MKKYVSAILMVAFAMTAMTGQTTADGSQPAAYDSVLATQLGADSLGMKHYVIAFLKSGPNRDQDPEAAAALQRAHLNNIHRLAESGKLILAGPFLDEGDIRGIFVFDVSSLDEAAALTATDPAVQAGRLVMELHPWYGSAAVMMVPGVHEKIAKVRF